VPNSIYYILFLCGVINLIHAQEVSLYSKTAQKIEDEYYETNRFIPQIFWKACIDRLQFILPPLELKQIENQIEIFYEGQTKGSVKISLANIKDTFKSCEDLVLFLEKTIPVDAKTILQESRFEVLQEGLKTLDPHTKLFTPEQTELFLQRNQNRQYGVGFMLVQDGDKMLIQSVLEGSPAETAGLRDGDIVIEINGILLPGPSAKELQKQIDQAETKVELTIEKLDTGNIEKLLLTKEALSTKAIESYLINEEVGYFRLKRFSEGCFDQFITAIRSIESGKGVSYYFEKNKWKKENGTGDFLQLQSYILDLRGNPGGLLKEAVRFCDYFLNNGNAIVTVKGGKGQAEVYVDTKGGNSKRPLIILLDGKSASASEILAGCLQSYHRALVVGSQSFGKGSVQQAEVIQGLKGAMGEDIGPLLKISVAEYFVADNEPIQNRGVQPNVELIPVDLTPGNIRLVPLELNRESDYLNKLTSKDTLKRLSLVQYDQILYVDDHLQLSNKPDIPIGLCARLLEGDGPFENEDWKNNEFYSRKKDLCKIIKLEESVKIIELLAKQGIPWEKGGEFSANLKAQIELVNLDDVIKAEPGKNLKLRVALNNKSNIPSFGVKGRLQFKSINMPIRFLYWGKLKEQELREAIVEIPIKAELAGGTYPFEIVVSDENGDLFSFQRKLLVVLPERSNLTFTYKVVKDENQTPDKKVEKYSFLIKAQNYSDLMSINNELVLENLRKEAYSLIEVLPAIQSDIPLRKNEPLEIKYDISIQNITQFKNQIPFQFHFRDFNSRQQIFANFNLDNAKQFSEWSSPIKDFTIELLPAPSFGLVLLTSTGVLKAILPGKGQVKSIYVVQGNNKKVFYKKLSNQNQNEKEEIAIAFAKTVYPMLYSLFIELANGSIHEKIICIQNPLEESKK
jgi:carboxyl-terminal processing protease